MKNFPILRVYATLAQLAEREIRNPEVIGSIPVSSFNTWSNLITVKVLDRGELLLRKWNLAVQG